MAGFIHITDVTGLSMSTISFDAITERCRKYFTSDEIEFERKIFEPVDEGEMSFISLIEQNQRGYMAFYRAAKKAYEENKNIEESKNGDSEFYKLLMDTWQELLKLLEEDSRFADA